MPPLPVSRLTPDDPENLLSPEARQRISAALSDFDRIKKQGLAAIETRYLAESPSDVSLWEYMGTGSGYIELIESRMQAARTVLRVEAEEYRKLGLPGRQFRQIMEEKIDAMVYSMEFSTLQRDALEAEVLWSLPQQTEDEPVADRHRSEDGDQPFDLIPAARSVTSASAAARVAAYIERNFPTKSKFAEEAHVDPRTLRRLLKKHRVSKTAWAGVAKAMGITLPELLPELLQIGH